MPKSSKAPVSRTVNGNKQQLYRLDININNLLINFQTACIFSNRAEIYAGAPKELPALLGKDETKSAIIQQLLEKIPRIGEYLQATPANNPSNFKFEIHNNMLAVTFILEQPLKHEGLNVYPNHKKILSALYDVTMVDAEEHTYNLAYWTCPRYLMGETWELLGSLHEEFNMLPNTQINPDPILAEKKIAIEIATLISFKVEELRIKYNSGQQINKNLLKISHGLIKATRILFEYLDKAKTLEEKHQAFKKYREDISPLVKSDDWDTDNQLENVKKSVFNLVNNLSKILAYGDKTINQIFIKLDEECQLFPNLNENHIKPLAADQLPSIKKIVDEIVMPLYIEAERMRSEYNLGNQINFLLLAKYKLIMQTTRILFENLEKPIDDNARQHYLKTYRKELMPILNTEWAIAEQLSKVKKAILKLIATFSIWLAKKDKKEDAETKLNFGIDRAVRWGAKILREQSSVVSTTLNYMGLFKKQLELPATLELINESISKNLKNSYSILSK